MHLDRSAHPKNVILFIGDGMGSAQRRLAEMVHGKTLVMNTLPIVGMFTNAPRPGKIARRIAKEAKISEDALKTRVATTDSAAAATALATGRKTENYVVSIGPEGKIAYQSLAEAAKRMGKSVGLISTTTITDATPAAFGAHASNRWIQDKIAEQYLGQGFEVIMGGGWQYFVPQSETGSQRKDAKDLIKAFSEKGYTIARSKDDLLAIDIQKDTKILGLFSASTMPFYLDRTEKEPDLSQMVEVAIKVLKQNPEGFFLVVEGARIDHASHANDPGGMVGDLLEFDEAVNIGADYLGKENPDTLLLVCADHETGGLSLGADGNSFIRPAVISGIKHSVAWLNYVLRITPDKAVEAFTEYTGISDLTAEEIAKIKIAVAPAAADEPAVASKNKPSSPYILAGIINKRIGIAWTSTGHTAAPLMLNAAGPGAVLFTGYYDQTDVGNKIADLWNIELTSWPVEQPAEQK